MTQWAIPQPPLQPAARHFIRRVARLYAEVLEVKTDLTADSCFAQSLELLAAEARIHLPADRETLAALITER